LSREECHVVIATCRSLRETRRCARLLGREIYRLIRAFGFAARLRRSGGKAEPKGIGSDSMPLFVAVVRYGALSRYRCVLAEDKRGSLRGTKRYADEFVARCEVHFRPGFRKRDDRLDRRAWLVAPFLERARADRADYTECLRFWKS